MAVRRYCYNAKFLKPSIFTFFMENKYVGYLVLGISVLIIIIIFMFNSALKEIVKSSCTEAHGDVYSCPMYQTINQQTYLSLGVVGLLIIVSFILIFSKPQKEIVFKTRTIEKKEQRNKVDENELKSDEKQVLAMVKDNKAIFQADLI